MAEDIKRPVAFSEAKRRVLRARNLKKAGFLGATLALALGFLGFAIVDSNRITKRMKEKQRVWAVKAATQEKLDAEQRAKEQLQNERVREELLQEANKYENEEILKRREGYLPRYIEDPITGQTKRDFVKVFTNELPRKSSSSTNSVQSRTNSPNRTIIEPTRIGPRTPVARLNSSPSFVRQKLQTTVAGIKKLPSSPAQYGLAKSKFKGLRKSRRV